MRGEGHSTVLLTQLILEAGNEYTPGVKVIVLQYSYSLYTRVEVIVL